MATTPASSSGEPPLPGDFLSIEQIQNLPNESINSGKITSVIGFVKGFQPPIQTKGPDCKCTLDIVDDSIRFESSGLKIVLFWAMEKMPHTPDVGDLVLVRKGKIQMWGGAVSLKSNFSTSIHFIAASKIPLGIISDRRKFSWQSYPPPIQNPLTAVEHNYVVWAVNRVKDIELPSDHEYRERTVQAVKVNKDKFGLLRDVKPERFYNILGQVIKLHDQTGYGHLTMYLSDYTYNSNFHNYVWGAGPDDVESRNGDEYCYIKPKTVKDWPGPFGKMTIQLTLFDEHAQFVRECVKINTWVLLKNVHVRFGKIGGQLEGYMRQDEGKINVSIVKLPRETKEEPADEEEVDPRCKEVADSHFKDAVQRKADYMKKFEKSQKAILEENPGLGNKRKHDGQGTTKPNSKQRRKEKREAALKNAAALDAKKMERSDLNENIRCNNPDQPVVGFSEILKPRTIILNADRQQTLSPFTCAKYRANVRVVDFFPHRIQDFAIGRRPSEFDILSDYSGGEDTDQEEDMRIFKSGKGFAKHIWEWRFALQVEDASSDEPKQRLWLMADNHAAQGLLNLEEDATNLRTNPKLLSQMKEQLFKLWGDLEERKSAKMEKVLPPSSIASDLPASSPPRKAGEMPDADSDAENEPSQRKSKKTSRSSALAERDTNISIPRLVSDNTKNSKVALEPKNKAFTCCIRQYGVKVDEEDPMKADAGDGKRWQRTFGLFGTQIV